MGIVSNIVAAEEDEIEAVGESLSPVAQWSGVELRDLDTGKIAMLHSLLTGDLFDDALAHYEPVYVSEAEGALVLRLADEVTQRLAELEEEAIEQIALELAATEEFESEAWDEDTIAALLADLSELARLADSQDQLLLVWIHPLRT